MIGDNLKDDGSNDEPSSCDLLSLSPPDKEWADELKTDEKIQKESRKRAILFTLIALCLVSLILGCAYRDLKQPLKEGTSKFELKQVSLDASQSLPSASFEFEFDYGSRLSKVTPTSLDCVIALGSKEGNDLNAHPAGRVHAPINIAQGEDTAGDDTSKKYLYVAQVSCPKEDVGIHADIVWSQVEAILHRPENRKFVDWSCSLEFRIELFSWVPIKYTVSVEDVISKSDMEALHDHEPQEMNQHQQESNYSPQESNHEQQETSIEERKTWDLIRLIQLHGADHKQQKSQHEEDTWIVRELNLQKLELARRVQLPPQFLAQVSDGIQIHLPPLTLTARASDCSENGNGVQTSLFQFHGVDHRFALEDNEPKGSSEMEWISLDDASMKQSSPEVDVVLNPVPGQNEFWALLSLTCVADSSGRSRDDCKLIHPMTDWYSKAKEGGDNQPISVHITVDSQGSFLEQVLGRRHALQIQWHSTKTANNDDSSVRRHLNPSPIQKELNQAKADCLGVTLDEAASLDVGLCWLLEASQGFTLTGELTMYDFGAQGVVKSKWSTEEDNKFTMTSTALLDVDKEDPSIMDMTNSLVIDWNEDDAVTMEMNMENTGSWKPFTGDFHGDGAIDGKILSANLNKGIFTLEGGTKFDLTGSFEFNADDVSLAMDLQDPAADIDCSLNGALNVDEEYFEGSTSCLWKGDKKWEASAMFSISDGGYSANITESLTNFKISSKTRWDFTYGDCEPWNILDDSIWGSDFSDDSIWGDDTTVADNCYYYPKEAVTVNFDEIMLRWDEGRKSLDWVGEYFQDFDANSIRFHMTDADFLDIAMNITARWEYGDEDENVFDLNFDRMLLEWKGKTRIDGEARLFLDFDNTFVNITISDMLGVHDIQVDSSMSWIPEQGDDRFQLIFDRVTLEWDNEIQGNLAGELDFNVDSSYFAIAVEDIDDRTDVLDFSTAWTLRDDTSEDVFVLSLERSTLQWDGEKYLDLSSQLMIGYDNSTVSFAMKDKAKMDFSLLHSIEWRRSTSGQVDGHVNFDNALFQVGSEVRYNSAMMFSWYETENDDFFFVIDATSSPSANLQLEMACEFQFDNDLDIFRMTMDHMEVTWRGEQRLSVGEKSVTDEEDDTTPEESPSSAPGDDNDEAKTGIAEVNFAGIEMTLGGVKEKMDDTAMQVFERTLEDYYHAFYSSAEVRRTLAEAAEDFDTEVTVTNQEISERGNEITYDQKLYFAVTSDEEVDEKLMAEIMLKGALKEKNDRDQLLEAFREHENFKDVSSVETSEVSDDSGDGEDDSKKTDSDSVALGTSNRLGPTVLAVLLGFLSW